ncbi:nucleotide sugar dehydrogenase [Acinetobacter johnsonii]|uniref:UDP-glucose 6-dehydrogenase n=1 Tax=Acinetobacter johnsonii TaxID=40214 RepID=A0AAV3WBE8_ACIJO|nr:nucleotide sugar dehydrogenase [Acinetobacter johnsonii]WQE01369.1 nucleotide sugar dehydrogenase [Acinetobacter johnsonii]GEK43278.1 UDP-glucose 6-dehydrogenase [Acinetobacter johnsonii]
MNICVFGTTLQAGVIAGLFAEYGHQVHWCPQIATENQASVHYQDENLNQLIHKQINNHSLQLIDLKEINLASDVFLFSFNPSEFDQAIVLAEELKRRPIIHPKLMINGSTFGLEGTEKLKKILVSDHWVYLPDTIQEGNAIQSFIDLKQILVGIDQEETQQYIKELLRPFFQSKQQFLFMPFLDAEFTKLSISGMLATRISYMNDMAQVAEKLNIDIQNVKQGLAADSRIGATYLSPGVGFGGENFSHDILTLTGTVAGSGIKSQLLDQVWNINEQQKEILFRKFWNYYQGQLTGKVVAIWGASFKENTSSIDNSPIHTMLAALWAQGVTVQLHDPQALERIFELYGERSDLILSDNQYQATEHAHALCILTAWKQYWSPDYAQLLQKMAHPLILDGRNILDSDFVKAQGFAYQGVGRV